MTLLYPLSVYQTSSLLVHHASLSMLSVPVAHSQTSHSFLVNQTTSILTVTKTQSSFKVPIWGEVYELQNWPLWQERRGQFASFPTPLHSPPSGRLAGSQCSRPPYPSSLESYLNVSASPITPGDTDRLLEARASSHALRGEERFTQLL